MAFAPFLRQSEAPVEIASVLFVSFDVSIDRCIGDRQCMVIVQTARDLFWTPFFSEQFLDQTPLFNSELPIAPGARSPSVGAFNGFAGPVGTIPPGGVAIELATDGASVPTQIFGDRRSIVALLSEYRDHIPILRGELVVLHD